MVDYRADTIRPKTPAGDILVTQIGPCVCLSERSGNLPQSGFAGHMLCTTAMIQSYVVHHQSALCIMVV